jgi:mRNA interferase RelE/StbE
MSFQIKFHPRVKKFLRKLQEDISKRIIKKINEIDENPFNYLEHFEGKNYYKLRIGNYRALIDIDFERKILFVQLLDKRGRIYKR